MLPAPVHCLLPLPARLDRSPRYHLPSPLRLRRWLALPVLVMRSTTIASPKWPAGGQETEQKQESAGPVSEVPGREPGVYA